MFFERVLNSNARFGDGSSNPRAIPFFVLVGVPAEKQQKNFLALQITPQYTVFNLPALSNGSESVVKKEFPKF